MKDLAFLILAHTDPVQVGRLCRALDHRARIFVHLDAKIDMAPFLAQALPDSVTFIPDRVTVSWAAYSQVEATLRMMRAALASGHSFSHLVMLSGMDYPIKPLAQLHQHLNRHPARQFIRFVNATNSAHYGVYFHHYWFLEAFQQLPRRFDRGLRHGFGRVLRPFLRKPLPPGVDHVYWGSAYWALTPDCAAHVLDVAQRKPAYVRWARSSFAVDEHFFHTIVGNSAFLAASDGVHPGEGNTTYRMASLHLIHPSLRKVNTADDFDALCASDKFFTRKLASGASDTLLQRLNNEVLQVPDLPDNAVPIAQEARAT